MVRKLFKHEFLAYARAMSVIYMILLTVAAATRVIQFFESETAGYIIVATITFTSYGVVVFGAVAFTFALALIRFYKNLFSAEGYLSFTLPVTPSKHIWVKALTALSFSVMTWIAILLSGCIVSAGEMLKEIFLVLDYLVDKLYAFADFHATLFIIEVLVSILASALSSLLLYYTFIAIGQLFKKNRILAAVGAYFVYYIISQVVSSVLSLIFSVFMTNTVSVKLNLFIQQHPFVTAHTILCGSIVLSGLFVVILFVVIRTIINKKLNLE